MVTFFFAVWVQVLFKYSVTTKLSIPRPLAFVRASMVFVLSPSWVTAITKSVSG